MFVRVRGATPGDPLHEFDVPVLMVERHPDRYKVVDPKPVPHQRPASYFSGVVPVRPVKRRVASPGEDSIAPGGADS